MPSAKDNAKPQPNTLRTKEVDSPPTKPNARDGKNAEAKRTLKRRSREESLHSSTGTASTGDGWARGSGCDWRCGDHDRAPSATSLC